MVSLVTWSAPALQGAFRVAQPDGSWLTVEQFGDEYHHWTATSDGMLVVNTGSGYYVAQIDAEGMLTASHLLAHEPALRSLEEQHMAEYQKACQSLFRQNSSRRTMSISESSKYLPHSGSPRVLVILAAFQDVAFTVNEPMQAFDQYLNADQQTDLGNHNKLNYSSVRKYFDASSHGAFTPQFDVVGPVTLPHEVEYYGKNENMSGLCKDAIELVKGEVNLQVYDNDNDSRAELVYIIFAGYGENQGGDKNTIWAKTSTQNLKVSDDLTITRFCCCSELFHPHENYKDYINGIGVFCHEFSHGMGLPDIYATSNSGYVNNQSMESWDVMDQGLYNYNGFAPALYLAWEQEVMGWLNIKPLSSSQESVSMLPVEEGGDAYKIQNPSDENEFIVMENIQQRGANYKANGHGLLVYHVAYPSSTVNMTDSPNNKAGHPSVAVIPADGLLISGYLKGDGKEYTTSEYRSSLAGDPFPGTNNTTTLSDQIPQPNFCFYTEEGTVGFTLNTITEYSADGMIVFDFINDEEGGHEDPDPSAVHAIHNGTSAETPFYNLHGQRVAHPGKGVFLHNGHKVVIK